MAVDLTFLPMTVVGLAPYHVCWEVWAIGAGLSIFALCPQVMQVLNADAIVVKLNSGDYKTIHLSSIRPPRLEGENTQVRIGRQRSLFIKTEGKMLENTYLNMVHRCENAKRQYFKSLGYCFLISAA